MKSASTQKTPVGVLADTTDEGLNPTTFKEQDRMTSLPKSAGVPTRLALDENTVVDVEPVADHIELTVTGSGRITFGLALDRFEARRLADALLDAAAPQFGAAPAEEIEEHVRIARKMPGEIPVSDLAAGTIGDVLRWSQDNDTPVLDVMSAVEDYISGMAEVERLSPAQFCKRQRQIMRQATY